MPLQRILSNVPGLDAVLKGGFFRGGIYLLVGNPGAGKTILANQFAFNHVAAGGRTLYVTLLAESHARLFSSLEQMEFFDPKQLGNSMSYLSGYQVLEGEKLDGLLKLLRKAVRDHKATLLVIDGLVTAGAVAGSALELKKFIHKLQVLVELVGCTTLILTGARNGESNYAERTMVDGLLELSTHRVGMRTVREVEVLKLRGSDSILGAHSFEITNAGISVHPRTEARLGTRAAPTESRQLLDVGIKSLDEMLAGGLFAGSTTLLLGSPGTGKTLLGLHFISAGAQKKEPGLYFGFFQAPSRIVSQAEHISLNLASCIKRGLIEVLWQPPLEQMADALAEKLIGAVKRRKVRRLFIDGLGGFKESIIYPERLGAFFTALSNELRSLGVTTIVSEETSDLFGPKIEVPVAGISAMVDNIVFLRHVELRSQLRRLLSVIKMRQSGYNSSLREFSISDRGVKVAPTFESAEAILSGIARLRLEHPTSSQPGEDKRNPRRRRS